VRAYEGANDSAYSEHGHRQHRRRSQPAQQPDGHAVTSSRIDLAWTDNSANEQGFKLERASDGVTFAVIATWPQRHHLRQHRRGHRRHI
jgi:hypothetical protein